MWLKFAQQYNHRPILFGILGQSQTDGEFVAMMDQKQGVRPKTKVEFVDVDGNVTDITAYYDSGGSVDWIKERAPDEIQAGDFTIQLFNHDNKFSEYKSTSLFYNERYHRGGIRIKHGFITSDGTEILEDQATGYIDELRVDKDRSMVTLRCRDLIREILDARLHAFPTVEVPAAGASNVGNGICTKVDTKPFKTVNENWTLTCTLAGGDATATFSVVGSVSGSVGTATSGTEFSTGTGAGGIKFTIRAGTTSWAANDTFTFTTKQYPEWSLVNPAKIIWSVLTGYNWDSNTQENWSGLVLDMSNERTVGNADINWESFRTAIDQLDSSGLKVTGYAGYNEGANEFMQTLLLIFLGSIFTDGSGRVKIRTWAPQFMGSTYRNFADSKKMTSFSYVRSVDEIINHVTVNYKKTDVWEFSDEDVNYDGSYVRSDSASITNYDEYPETFTVRWFSTSGAAVIDFATRFLGKFAAPPLNMDFDTGHDALRTEIGDAVSVTESKYGFDTVFGEVTRINKQFDAVPVKIVMRVRRDDAIATLWGFLGSSDNENDGLSPQTANWDSATASDKLFAYLSQDGGGGPDYRMF